MTHYFEDFSTGQVFVSQARTLTETAAHALRAVTTPLRPDALLRRHF